jgi:serine/threonine protein kinase
MCSETSSDSEDEHFLCSMKSADIEDIDGYEPGRYHPVALGDVLDGRFRVAHKLDFDGDATVWLCRDNVSNKWRAVRILCADESDPDDCADLRALEHFKDMDPDVLAANHHIQLPLDHFWLDGPNGRHLCLVLPFLGASVDGVCGVYGHVAGLMKDICFQMVEALRFLHSHNMCHGDFRPEKILFRLVDGVDEWEEEAVMDLLGKPRLEPCRIEHEPGKPEYLVAGAVVPYGSGACLPEIVVTGFSESYMYPFAEPLAGRSSTALLPYAAPEEFFEVEGYHLGFPADVWALGVSIARVRYDILPFIEGLEFPYEVDEMDFFFGIAKMERFMGPVPHPYRMLWKADCKVTFEPPSDLDEYDEREGPLANDILPEGGVTYLADDSKGWNDETVLTTIEEGGKWIRPLLSILRDDLEMDITYKQGADIAAQAAANPGRLPAFKPVLDEDDWDDEDDGQVSLVQWEYRMPDAEAEQLLHLFSQIFRWHPEQRATLDQIAHHEWFGKRA